MKRGGAQKTHERFLRSLFPYGGENMRQNIRFFTLPDRTAAAGKKEGNRSSPATKVAEKIRLEK